MKTIDLSREQIREEVQGLREAAEKIPQTREAAAAFLERIGAVGWKGKASKADGSSSTHRGKKR